MECKVRDATIYYEEIGAGRPIFMLHGWTLDHHYILHDMEPLFSERAGWRRIYPDLPGMGKTRAPDWLINQDQILDILLEFIDTVAPGERFAITGTSYGGYLARGVVYRKAAQMDGVMLNVPSIEQDGQKRDLPKHRVVRQDMEFLAALTPDEQDLKEFLVVQNLEVLELLRNFAPAVALADHEFLKQLSLQNSFSFEVDTLPQPFPAPSLFIMGRFDHWAGYQDAYRILENYPRATYAVLDAAGHALSFEQKGLFQALVGDWLDRVEAYTLNQSH